MHADPGLYKDAYERDSCGFGLIASLDDRASHDTRGESLFLVITDPAQPGLNPGRSP